MQVAVRHWIHASLAGVLAAVSLTALAAPAHAALGDRPLSMGSRGNDVRALQDLLHRAGFSIRSDGAFGSGTASTVRRLERELGLQVDGVVTAADVRRIRLALRPAAGTGGYSTETMNRPRAVSAQTTPGEQAALTEDGLAIPPVSAPDAVKQVIAAGNEIAAKPYRYGGGHGSWEDTGYDCSGSVSYALHGGGLLDQSMPSGSFSSWGVDGPGQWITTYSNGGHIYMVVAGLRFDTSGRSGTGSRWQQAPRSASGFTVRHPEGF
jgi:peptidoglycan hydrolase-like protein with peptidoglycan-binding domain